MSIQVSIEISEQGGNLIVSISPTLPHLSASADEIKEYSFRLLNRRLIPHIVEDCFRTFLRGLPKGKGI